MEGYNGRVESPMPMAPSCGVLGTLALVGRKTGTDMQVFPIDVENITIGRDYDCDVRLYYLDISKIHAEIHFDLMTGQSALHVLGANGVWHASEGNRPLQYKPPSVIDLSDNDTLIIRKKHFRFNYGPPDSPLDTSVVSPAIQLSPLPSPHSKTPTQSSIPATAFSPAGHLVRRRASHRLSLVPTGKKFVPFALSPAKNRRHSTLGLGLGGINGEPSRTKLAQQIEIEEAEMDFHQQSVVIDVVEGEEGDKVYLEATEEEGGGGDELPRVIHDNPFMTPQAKGKISLSNASAIPQSHTLTAPPAVSDGVALDTATLAPSSPHRSPSKLPNAITPVPAHVALSTPKGPATLRKALLLRSARKVWHQTHATGIEGAIQDGHVETRRKSTSPRNGQGRKSTSPKEPCHKTDVDADMESSSDEELYDLQAQHPDPEDGQLQWIQEDGQGELSFESDSSEMDSFNVDASMDIPGQGLLQLGISVSDEEEYRNNPETSEEVDHVHFQEQVPEESEYETEAQGKNFDTTDQQMDADKEDDDAPMSEVGDEAKNNDMTTSSPGTPQARPVMSSKFFTPQVPRSMAYGQTRRSLGPPVRLPATPDRFASLNGARMLGSLGKPSRRLAVSQEEDMAAEEAEEEDEKDNVEPSVVWTPVKRSAAAIAETKRMHEALATPRTLPRPPMSGFRDIAQSTQSVNPPIFLATPTHPALVPRSPEPESDSEEKPSDRLLIPGTPLNDVKKRLDHIRRQSVHRQGIRPAERRATVGVVLPGTPAQKPVLGHSASYSVSRSTNFVQAQRTPIFPLLRRDILPTVASPGDMEVDEGEASPTPPSQGFFAVSPTPNTDNAQIAGLPTPSFRGVKDMAQSPMSMRTPNFSGIRALYPPMPKFLPSPSFVGVKDMFAEEKDVRTPNFTGVKAMLAEKRVAPTPNMTGVKRMFGEMKVSQTPQMEGMKEMYYMEDEESVEPGVCGRDGEMSGASSLDLDRPVEADKVITKPAAKLPTIGGSSISGTTSKATPSAEEHDKGIRAAPAPEAISQSVTELKPKPSRTRTADIPVLDAVFAPEFTSRSTRTRRGLSTEPAASSAAVGPARSTRARSKAPEQEAEEQIEERELPAAPEAVVVSSRSKPTSSRTTRKASAEVEEKMVVDEKPSRATRGKRPLSQIPEQPIVEVVKEKKSAPTRATKRSIPAPAVPSTAPVAITRRTVSAPSRTKSSATASSSMEKGNVSGVIPTRRKGRNTDLEEKENHENFSQAKEDKPAVKRRATTTGGSSVPVATQRVTRSRK